MIVVDTSALIAVVAEEVRMEDCSDALSRADEIVISAGTMVEYEIVSSRPELRKVATKFIDDLGPRVVAVDAAFARSLGQHYRQWGRGFHKAGLNMGDCYAYTLAQLLELPLLFIGNDFSLTDVRSVLANPSPEQS